MKEVKTQKTARSIPFWSWNGELDEEKLCKQIEWMKEHGFEGFFMHARSGLTTKYMGEKWFSCVKACAKKAKELGMEAWAYDENGWPSGIAGGEMLYDKRNWRHLLAYEFGARDFSALVSYDISGEKLVRLSGDTPCETCLNLYDNVSERAVDCLNGEVMDRFLQCTHERYLAEFGENFADYIKGFFTDEPTCGNFPQKIYSYFEENYGEDVLDGLGNLFVDKKGFRAFRYKYYTACQKLFASNYVKKIYDWCEKHGIIFTGHYVEEAGLYQQMLGCCGTMPLYAHMHMPGIDWLCRRFINMIPIKQLVSVCAQLEKKNVLTEAFAMTGWDVTPTELKAIGDFQYMFGINVTSQHLLPYSEAGWRKNDHPVHFSPIVPWMNEGMKEINSHFNRLGEWVANTKERVRVAVLHPLKSAYGCYKKTDCGELYGLDARFREYSELLADRAIAYHYVDETVLEEHGYTDGQTLVCGACKYDFVIIPPALSTLSKYTEMCLRAYVKNGGKLLIAREKPRYLEGEEFDFSYLESNVTLEEIERAQEFSCRSSGGKVRAVCRENAEGKLIMLVNIDPTESAVCEVAVSGKRLRLYDTASGKLIRFGGVCSLKPLQSAYLLVSETDGEETTKKRIVDIPCAPLQVTHADDNALVLDEAWLSFDGKTYSEECYPLPAIFDELLQKRYDGDVYLKFRFQAAETPARMLLWYDDTQKSEFFVNGNAVSFNGKSSVDEAFLLADVTSFVKAGKNEIVQKTHFYQSETTYHCLYGGGEIRMPENTLSYETYFEPLRLLGDFGVYTSAWQKSDLENVFLGENFYVGKRKTEISDMLFDGYAFFAGKIRLQTTLHLDETDVCLRLTGRTHYAKLFVNGNYTGAYVFDDVLDISAFAKHGENVLQIELYTGARNLLGPFHLANAVESFYATPESFVWKGWKDFSHPNYRKSYALVRTGIFDFDGQFRLPNMDK